MHITQILSELYFKSTFEVAQLSIDLLTRLPYTRFSSRLVDRLLIEIEGGRQ